jgi:hypothetical protein
MTPGVIVMLYGFLRALSFDLEVGVSSLGARFRRAIVLSFCRRVAQVSQKCPKDGREQL